jgi:hypothetical protein
MEPPEKGVGDAAALGGDAEPLPTKTPALWMQGVVEFPKINSQSSIAE